jgi:hypothetical protein
VVVPEPARRGVWSVCPLTTIVSFSASAQAKPRLPCVAQHDDVRFADDLIVI